MHRLGLSKELLRAVDELNYREATPIQRKLIPAIFSGGDILATATTGTGKTAGFLLPILDLISQKSVNHHYPKALIIAPTRELVRQLHSHVEKLGRYKPIKSIAIYGGSNISREARELSSGVDIIVATTGRLIEHIEKRTVNLSSVRYLVLDEADTILDMGFIKEVTTLLSSLPKNRQTTLVSATLTSSVRKLANSILTKKRVIEVDRLGAISPNIREVIYPVVEELKDELLSFLIGSNNYKQVLIFVSRKDEAQRVERELNLSGLKTVSIHGDKSVGKRAKALEEFKNFKARVLVATDIASRGLDIPNLEVVINYDIPYIIGEYIHRVGRTGRAGADGLAISLLSPKDEKRIKSIERLTKNSIKREILKEYAPKGSASKARVDIKKGSSDRKRRVAGAFGKKGKSKPTTKKRKTTKRDGFKSRS